MIVRRLGFAVALLSVTPASLAAPSPSKPDLALMRACVSAVESPPALQSESEIQIRGVGQGMTTNIREHIRFTRLRSGEFRSDITLALRGQYQIISDGKHVWTFDPINGEYAVTPQAEYLRSYNLGHHIAGLGLFGALVIGSVPPQQSVLQSLTVLLATQAGASAGTGSVGGQPLRMLALRPAAGPQFRFWLDPKTRRFQQMEFTNKGAQLAFTMTEKVMRQSFRPKLDAEMFHFTPPANAKLVPTIQIGSLP